MTIKDLFRSALQNAGIYLSRTVSPAEVREFISLLRPEHAQDRLVRVGGSDDGGYLIPDDFDGVRACVSPGVDHTASFEDDLSKRGITSYLCDYSVEGPPAYLKSFTFDKKFLGLWNDDKFLTFNSWFEKYSLLDEPGDLVLQMDIEGNEWLALASLDDELLKRFRYVLIELHELSDVVNPVCYRLYHQVLQKLSRHFAVAHIHPNNYTGSVSYKGMDIPRVLEVTYVRRDHLVEHHGTFQFPHPLDEPCRPGAADLALQKIWWTS